MAQPRSLFVYFRSFHQQFHRKIRVLGIRTCILGIEVEHTDHMTTTTAQRFILSQILLTYKLDYLKNEQLRQRFFILIDFKIYLF